MEKFRSLAVRPFGSFIVIVHGSLAPSLDEWHRLLGLFRTHQNLSVLRTLVCTEGGAPNAAQRADLGAVLGSVKMPIAVVTESIIARGAGVALSWLNPALRVFGPKDFDGALDHLGATGNDGRTLRTIVDELRRELLTSSLPPARRDF